MLTYLQDMHSRSSDLPELARRIHRLSAVLGRILDRHLMAEFGFGMSQFKILWMLDHHAAGVKQSTIAEWLNQTEAAISRQMKPMKDIGLITSKVDPKSRRTHIVLLTDKGKQLVDKGFKILIDCYEPCFKNFNRQKRVALTDTLDQLFLCAIQMDDSALAVEKQAAAKK